MSDLLSTPSVAFVGSRCVAAGPLGDVALAVKALETESSEPLLVFDEATGTIVDLDLRGDAAEIVRRLQQRSAQAAGAAGTEESHRRATGGSKRGRGRPKLGVVSREVTLLPRHWDWLGAQPGGASQALRRLVDQARRADGGETRTRAAREAAYRFLTVMAGDLPGFEEAIRALFANDRARFAEHASGWPEDVRRVAERRAFGEPGQTR